MAEAEQKPAPAPLPPKPQQTVDVADVAKEGEKFVTLVFPKAVNLCLDGQRLVKFGKGPNQVPASLADHWYLKAHGVQPYSAKAPLKKGPPNPDKKE